MKIQTNQHRPKLRKLLCPQLCEVCIDVFSTSWLLADVVTKAACQSLSSRSACFPRVVLVGCINILKMKKHAGVNSKKDCSVIDDTEEIYLNS